MTQHYRDLLFTPRVRGQQQRMGSRAAYGRETADVDDAPDVLAENEAMFIAARDSFYLASVGESGWPYIQHRGGPKGFVKILGERLIGFADYRGNRQYISLGNIAGDSRVSLFFMDYARRARLKLLGRMRAVDLTADAALAERLIDEGYGAKVERGLLIEIEAFDWNCPQHITPRVAVGDVEAAIHRLSARIADLEAENAALKGKN